MNSKVDKGPVMLKKVSIPSKATLGQLKDKTLKQCDEACQQYIGCNAYQYNDETKLCDLSNVTQLNDELKPSDGNWDIYLVNPVITKVNCEPPKDVAGAKKSYTTTTYKSEVTYTCPGGQKLKSKCKNDNKWTPVASSCKVSKIYFVKVKSAILDVPGKTLMSKKDVTAEVCAEKCLSDKNCLSFEIKGKSGKCYLSKETAASSKKIKAAKSKDYYQRVNAEDDILKFESTLIPGEDTFKRLKNMTLKECDHACHQTPGCNSYEYNEKAIFCDRSNATHLAHDLEPDQKGWDTYVINPAYARIDCGPPKDIVDTLKSYKTTAYKSEVLYTCSDGIQLKSICQKDNKWTPVASSCKDPQLHFVKIKDAALDVPGKKLLDKQDVTADECAEKCLSDESCLSFEITKGNRKCYLSEKSAVTSKKLKGNKDRDYYQRVKLEDKPVVMKKVSVPRSASLGELKNVNLKECNEACDQYLRCNSYQYNVKDKLCDLSDATQLNNELKPNDGSWNLFIVTPVVTKVNCGAPEDVAGASKSYDTTTYKSEVIYTCRDGEELKATCKENEKWAPAVSCKATMISFVKVKGAILDVPGKTLWSKKNVSAEACAEKCLSEKTCLSFEITKGSRKCYLSNVAAASVKKMKAAKDRDYYQQVKSDDDLFTFKKTAIPGHDTFGQIKGVTLKECDRACLQIPGCKSYEYHAKKEFCNPSNETHLTYDLKPNKDGWDIHIMNPAYNKIDCGTPRDIAGASKSYNTTKYRSEVIYKCPREEKLVSRCEKDKKWTVVDSACEAFEEIDCGNPKDIAGADKSYETTTYKSEVTYTCPEGEQIKSICEKDNKWSPIVETCKDTQIHFVKVKGAALAVPGKIFWNKENVTVKGCAEKCLSVPNCLSFEINKVNGKCFLSKQAASSSKNMKTDSSKDYYQRVKFDKGPIMLKKVGIPSKATLGQLKDKTLKECDKACQQYEGCNSYQYNDEFKLCDLSNATQLSDDVLKPSDGKWDIYLTNPVITIVNCGPPKDVVEAKKSYTTTTYKSEVTYTCPGGRKLKSMCKDDNKWTPVTSNCKVSKIHFVKVKGAILDVPGKTLGSTESVTTDVCAEKCLSNKNCLSFEMKRKSGKCYLSKETAASSKKIKAAKGKDYYQRVNADDDILEFKSTSIPGEDIFEQLKDVTIKECDHACHQTPGCNSYEYKQKAKFCDRSNVTHLTHDLEPNKKGWDTYVINPAYSNINCGPPKDIVDTSKSYKATTYKSEVLYTCSNGIQLKSICQKDNKWTPVGSSCKDPLLHFVKIKDAALDVPGKTVLDKEDVTEEECAKKFDDKPVVMKKVSVPRSTTLGELENVNLNDCNEACNQYLGCNSFQYNEQDKLCELTNATQLNNELKPNDGSWDIYIVTPVHTMLDCGAPKDVAGASKSYDTTTYNSEVIYTCQGGEELKAKCRENKKWAPVVSCKADDDAFTLKRTAIPHHDTFDRIKRISLEECDHACLQIPGCKSYEYHARKKFCNPSKETHLTYDLKPNKDGWDIYIMNPAYKDIDCGNPKDIAGAAKSYEATTYKSEVTYTCPEGEKLKSICEKDNKWTPIVETCKDAQIHFVKVKGASLAESGKIFWKKENVTAKACAEKCLSVPNCLSFETNKYNDEVKLCDLNNATQLSDKLKPNDGQWDIYLANPVITKINCGPPKDVVGAKKSYTNTTYKSEVTYTCPGGQKLKSKCKDDNKWTPVTTNCKVSKIHFVKVKGAILDVLEKTLGSTESVTADVCAEKCLSDENCLSFETKKESGKCYLSKENAASSHKIKAAKSKDYYQRINADVDILKFKSTSIPGEDIFEQLKNVTLKECDHACHQTPGCNSYEYKEQAMFCDRSNATHLTHDLEPDKDGWDTYVINPAYARIDCGPPKDIVGTLKSYKTTAYKSEVLYTCSNGIQLKSICQKDNKWTPVASSCKDPQLHFVKIKDAALDVPDKTLLKDVTADECAEKCLSDESCLAFEITKGNGKCYLSKKTAATSKKIKGNKDRDYYQRVKLDDKPVVMKKVSVPRSATLGELENVNLNDCNEACNQYLGCNSFQYNEQDKLCELTNATQLNNELKPNDGSWDIYIVSPVVTKVNCGAPKDVVGASKSYDTTTYESEVIYTCQDEEELKATCKENKKWAPEVSCKVSKINFVKVKGAILDVPGKTMLNKKNVTAEACAEKSDDDAFTLKRTAIPRPDTSNWIKGVTLKECDHVCLQIPGCKSYEYHEKKEFCNPSNESHLTYELKPNKDGWDIHIMSPAIDKINCGQPRDIAGTSKSYSSTNYRDEVTYTCPHGEKLKSKCGKDKKWTSLDSTCDAFEDIDCGNPKDITGAAKSYETTTYKSEVTYTCPEGEKLKSICEKDNKWTPTVETCKDAQIHFVKVKGASLAIAGKTVWKKKNLTAKDCAEKCLSIPKCLSFEVNMDKGKCFLSKDTAATSKKIMTTRIRDYYQRIKFDGEPVMLKKVHIPKKATLGRLRDKTLKECDKACQQYEGCNTYQYNNKSKLCDLSNATQLSDDVLKPNDGNWDIYLFNPAITKVNCGPPEDVIGAKKSYTNTTYKSEVTYTCPGGQKLKSKCKSDNKWTPVASNCEASKIHFVKVKGAILDVPGKTLWKKKKVTSDVCAKKCLSDKNCLSFEIKKESGKCYLSKVTAASNKKIKAAKSRDYYQRIEPNKDILKFKSTSIPGEDIFEQLKDVTIKECDHACHQTPGCNSYEYKEQAMFCDQSNATHLTHDLEPDKDGWDTYVINPAYARIDCGPPKDIVGTSKSYKNTAYKSEVLYTCSNGVQLKSICQKDNKWTPVASSCKADDKPFMLRKVSVSKKAKIGHLKDVKLKDCHRVCNHYAGCNSYQYNEKDKLCDLSNATQMSNELKPNDASWNIYILNPVVTKVDCGAPEDVVGASKSYDTTTHESEVIYTCHDGKELKATCKENKKWDPVVSCKVTKIYFTRVKDAILDVPGKTLLRKKNVTTEVCADKCLSDKTCLSFEITKGSGKCYLSRETAATSKKMKAAKDRDYYQRVDSDDDVLTFKKTAIPGHDTFDQIGGISLKECDHACLQIPGCKSYEYHEANKSCIPSNETLLTYDLKPNKDGWDIYIMNPANDKINCGPPRDIAGASKSCTSSNYRDKVIYTCPLGEKLKSKCEKDSKWTSLDSTCKAYKDIDCGNPKDIAGAEKSYETTTYKSEVTYTCPEGEKLKSICEKDNKWSPIVETCKVNEGIITMKTIGIPSKATLAQLNNKTLKECEKTCHKYIECNSYQYNAEDKLCDLSNVTQLSDELKPTNGNWDIYLSNPVITKVNCGPPKDIVGTKKSYTNTTYKSEVTYTCPGGQQLKSKCKNDNKWTPVASSCKVSKINFVKVEGTILDVSGKTLWTEDVHFTLKRTVLPHQSTFERIKDSSLKQCNHACLQTPGCTSYEYNEKKNFCDRSNVTHLTHDLRPDKGGWDIYIINPAHLTVSCGPPKDIVGAKKLYRTNSYKAEVSYICPNEELIKSTCEKDSKWTPVPSTCKDSETHFVKVKDAVLDVSGKRLLHKKNVTADACAKRCFSDEKCLSFEIIREEGKCYLSKKTATKSKKMKSDKNRDYYQRIQSDDQPVVLRNVSFPKQVTLKQLKDTILKECKKSCHQYPGCNSFQYNKKDKLCDLSNATHLTNELKPNDGSWDVFIINPAHAKVNCGQPKDVAGALKSYDTTTYKSEVNYTCQDGEQLKAVCQKDKKWTPEVSCKVTRKYFVKVRSGTLDVPKKLLWNKENVTVEDCSAKCLSQNNCLSFEINKENRKCYLSKETAATSKKIKSAKDRDYYQRVKPDDDVFTLKRTTIPLHDTFGRINRVTLKECERACLQIPGCKSYEYHENKEFCNPSNETHLTNDLKPDKDGWDIYIMNPVYSNVSCETPKDIAHTSKSYNSTNYRSEVTYTCPGGEKFKSICGKDNKWTPMISLCKDFKNQFVEVNDSLLDVPAKKLWKKKNVTAEACAKKCFSDKKCLSFEISKRSGKCFLSKNTAATSNKLKAAKTRNYYQRIKPKDRKTVLRKVSILQQDILKQLQNVNLKKCNEACHQHPECNAFEYKKREMVCDLSNGTHMTDKLKPNDGNGDTYIFDKSE
ncbi:von Willebrand factor type A, EGF and pentraxin domain-containing 1-like [Octopus vulgaris]|uniref:von Willebrand factor type A, EGF and pentraxin domain-containing 1-like n=1 Tax=Octopus vulgaris TaxID=6645 RepID=A0AA36F8W4_OCTVU|nr:von Willebrand factor type A, EGF and pentraxin domain-containing 1-like [Octopus vulgaris]